MPSDKTVDVARRAKKLYEEELRSKLELTNMDDFVAIEPDSGDYYFGKTLSGAIRASREAHPDRIAFAIRVGHESTIHIGVMSP